MYYFTVVHNTHYIQNLYFHNTLLTLQIKFFLKFKMQTLNRVVCWNKNSFRQFNFGSFKFRYSVRVNLVANFDLGFVKQELACNASK